ncbi:cation transporter [Oxalobacteraceae bacterium OM1]|nr:cation transporter [Oxalobacteraceae bacterium OM1]
MSACCSGGCHSGKPPADARYRRVLWIALAVNAAMFVVELCAGWRADSVALLADAVDFFGDAANYAVSLFVLGLAPVWRSRTALLKGLTMGGYGLFILGKAAWSAAAGSMPEPATMGLIGLLALAANGSVAILLYAYRDGDANMRSVWLCTRNDAIGNVAVMLAALGVFGSGSSWPDLAVAAAMGLLGVTAAVSVVKHARAELKPAAWKPVSTSRGPVSLSAGGLRRSRPAVPQDR